MHTPTLFTARLTLRPLRSSDAPAVFSCWESDPAVAKYMFWTSHNDPHKTENWVAQEVSKIASDDWYRLAVVDREKETLLGTVLLYLEPEHGFYEVGYNFGRAYWGQGYATEAMRALIRFARDTLGLRTLVARYAKENPASGNVLRKLGFQYVRDIPYEANDGAVLYEGEELRLVLAAPATVELRPFTDDDLPRYRAWLHLPHVRRWYHDPADWLHEVGERHGTFAWLNHFIILQGGNPIGFCQYYSYARSEETWHGSLALAGTYSIDYLIGETACLGQGLGRQTILALIQKIRSHADAVRIIVQPEPENAPSCGTLLSCGFHFDKENELYLLELPQE